MESEEAKAVFGGGCFWCTEAVYKMVRGVTAVMPGYAGGDVQEPSYEDVSKGTTGHAEVVEVTYDPAIISYADLLDVFFGTHDPTTKDRQGNDMGPQYRSVILYTNEVQHAEAEKYVADLDKELGGKITTQIVPLERFYPAESYHKDYYENNRGAGYCQAVIEPKLIKVRKRFKALLKDGDE